MSTQIGTNSVAAEISMALGWKPISPTDEVKARVDWIKDRLTVAGCRTLVLGISGGVDSMVAGGLCQRAINELREETKITEYQFIAVRLPYGVQADADDAARVIQALSANRVEEVDIKKSVDGMMAELVPALAGKSGSEIDFIKGNIKARARMIAQYALANAANGLVVGTDHAAEAVMGFFTKFGDGACDIAPLSGLSKRQVRSLGTELGLLADIIDKTPTADLEDLDPGKPDETAYGVTYEDIDNYLALLPVDERVADAIEARYLATQHKRELPYVPVPITD